MAAKYTLVLAFILVMFLSGGFGQIEEEFRVSFFCINLFEK